MPPPLRKHYSAAFKAQIVLEALIDTERCRAGGKPEDRIRFVLDKRGDFVRDKGAKTGIVIKD